MTDFETAQQAANVAYEMTLRDTGDHAKAADDYKSVMQAYHAACTERGIENVMDGLTAADIAQIEAMCAETASEPPTHDGMWM